MVDIRLVGANRVLVSISVERAANSTKLGMSLISSVPHSRYEWFWHPGSLVFQLE